MRILVVDIANGPMPGGSLHRTMSLSSHLRRQGVEVRWLLLRSGADEQALCATYDIPPEHVQWVECISRRFKVMMPNRSVGRLVAGADVVCLSTFLWGAAPLAWIHARRRGVPWVVSPHGSVPYFGRSLALKRIAHAACGRSILRGAAAVVAVNDMERRALAPWVDPHTPVRVIPNGIEPLQAGGEVAAGGVNSPVVAPYVLFLGRLSAEKGVDLLLEGLASIPPALLGDLTFVIAGEGPERSRLEAMTRQSGLDRRVRFAGWVDGPAKARLLQGAAFVVIPSKRDAMTLVALEAGAAGRPLLISSACGFPQASTCGGGVQADATPDGIRDGLLQMLAARDRWPTMGEALRTLVLREYLWSHQAARFRELLETVARRPPDGYGPIS